MAAINPIDKQRPGIGDSEVNGIRQGASYMYAVVCNQKQTIELRPDVQIL